MMVKHFDSTGLRLPYENVGVSGGRVVRIGSVGQRALALLANTEEGSMPLADLVEELGRGPAGSLAHRHNTVDRLADAGLVEKSEDRSTTSERGRQSKLVTLTDDGWIAEDVLAKRQEVGSRV